ncbi:FG-GAP-like repeat-containing protein [Streptomyces sp. NPDC101490]|uniref:FG-GAP-like repeat-containing protein n=1 Tax=Streptomyces sp. NPDC101490 TaxID=3366143 RepID=UPI0038038EFD
MRTPLSRRLASTAAALGLTSLALFGAGAAPAQAATVRGCPDGYFCAWSNSSATGAMFKTKTSKPTLGSWDNKFREVINRSSLIACLYDGPGYDDSRGYSTYVKEDYSTHIASTSVSSVKMVPTRRECETDPYPYWSSETSPRALGFGDLNGDRKADVLVRDLVGRLWFLPGDGRGRLVGSGWNGMNALVRHGDFSRDGREDVIAREAATGKLWLYPGTGTGALGTRKLLGSGGWNSMSRIAALGDLTGDQRSDLLTVEKATGRLWLYPGTSTGTLGGRKLIGSGGWNSMNALVGPGDMDGDGRADLYAREASTGKLWLYPGKVGGIGARKLVGSGGWNSRTSLIANGDWSGDGKPDLIATAGLDWLVQYEGTGRGGLGAGQETTGTWWSLNGAF